MRLNEEFNLRKDIMEEKFSIEMTKDEMLRFYENKIVEDGIRSCSEFNTTVFLTDYNSGKIKLEKYKDEILQLLYRDERIADVVIDDELNIDMVFYTDYCPFYYDDEARMTYNEIIDSPTYQGVMLASFIDYMINRVNEESYISTRMLINNFVEPKQMNRENKEILSNFLKKSIIQTGFVDKYIDNISIYVTYKNYKELETGLQEIIKQKDEEAKKEFFETEEFE